MGAWGHTAYENDTAGDWVWKRIVRPAARLIRSKRADTDEVLLALALVVDLKLAAWFDPAELKAALARVREDDKTREWKDPAKRARYLAKLARGFKVAPQARWSPIVGVFAESKRKDRQRSRKWSERQHAAREARLTKKAKVKP
jgi:hypothetical protein